MRVALPALVLAAALLVGAGVFSSATPSLAQRAAAIERVAAAGRSTAQIEQTLVSQYGSTILLEPPDTGGIALIWVVPIALGLATLGVVGVLFWRRARQFASLQAEQTV